MGRKKVIEIVNKTGEATEGIITTVLRFPPHCWTHSFLLENGIPIWIPNGGRRESTFTQLGEKSEVGVHIVMEKGVQDTLR